GSQVKRPALFEPQPTTNLEIPMKTLIKTLVVAVIGLSFISTGFAGDKMKDCVHMKDGKMMMMKDGKEMAMEKDMTMKDGTKVMTDGTVVKKDGEKMMMKDGDMMYMSGKMKKGEMKEGEKKS
ncbi:MAG: DUF6799 domain-containing protein, partial [Verrucomicrobiota bacterium]